MSRTDAPLETEAADDRPTPQDIGELYRLSAWGEGIFRVNAAGHIEVVRDPANDHSPALDLYELVHQLQKRDLQTPVLIRFTDVLRRRIATLADAFNTAMTEQDYQGGYRAVYPIKVNQQRHVVEETLRFGSDHGFGLEAGSKPELLALMATVHDSTTPIICNGFKDEQFIEAVVLSTKLGRNIIPVVEKFSELHEILRQAKRHDVRPKIGVRVKLAARGAGRWETSGGVRSKFGLFVSEVVEAMNLLREHDMLDCLKLVHFHMGSQIHDVRQIKSAVNEAARIYADMHKAGAGIDYLDVGGGLGVDYDGSKAAVEGSMNYSLQEYANNVVYHIAEVANDAGVPHPTILTECGRAMVAHHSVLVLSVLGWSGFKRFMLPDELSPQQLRGLPRPVRMLYESHRDLSLENYSEYFHDAQLFRDETIYLFNLGYCNMEQRGLAERLFFSIASKVQQYLRDLDEVPEPFAGLQETLADTYFGNWSVFQSLPDSWAIDQIFPIVPIHRLTETPTCRGVLADITCDSDGKVSQFVTDAGQATTLPLHPFTGDPYYLGVFLVGAYQEILGDLHNLFGDTNAVHVGIGDDGSPIVEQVVPGDSVGDVLRYVQFKPEDLKREFRQSIERAVRENKLSLDESQFLWRFYESGLGGYTYLT